MKNRIQFDSATPAQSTCLRYQSRLGTSEKSAKKESRPCGGLMSLCKEIAGTLIKRYAETGNPRKACDEVRSVLTEKIDCSPERAIAMIDLALELIRLNCYGEYRRNDLELSLLVSKAAGHVGEQDLN